MSRLSETSVQNAALDYLRRRYKGRARGGKIFARTEVRTKSKYGRKRADGLLAYRHWLWGVYVVSLEAKSYKTLPAIKPRRDKTLYLINSIRAGIIISILSGSFFVLYKWNDGFWQFIIPASVMLIGGIAYAWLTRSHFGHKTIRVIEQIEQYPADERWLAFSNDSFLAISREKQQQLENLCRYHGLGLLIVSPGSRVKMVHKARSRWDWWRDYLRFYTNEKEIRKAI